MASNEVKVIAKNRKAHHDYFIEETYEAGIANRHRGESIRLGKVNRRTAMPM